MSQIGRIGGQVLSDNLLRAGIDLAFETDLLYLNVTDKRIGIRKSNPVYDLDVNSHIVTNGLTATATATIDDIRFTAPNTIGSILSPIDVYINGPTLYHDRLTTSSLEFDDNFISSFSNSNILLDPNGTGTLEVYATTNITGNLGVSGNILVPGNLRSDGIVTVGDSPLDTVTIAPDLTQSIIPGNDILYDLGSGLKRWRNGYSNNVDVKSGFTAGNITVSSPSTISVSSGNISINIPGSDPVSNFTGAIQTSGLSIEGNLIEGFSNQNIRFNPNGAGFINLESSTNVTGNLAVSGNTILTGDLAFLGTITIGDQTIDTVTVNTDFTQSIIPGDDLTYALGADPGDSSPRRWAQVYSPGWQNISTGAWPGSGIFPLTVTISDQTSLNGVTNKISTIQSNEDILLNPDTGITYIESTKWEGNYLTNLANTPLIFTGLGRNYVRYDGTNGLLIPSGTDAERRSTPELGETRWNTDQGYLECWDGSNWVISIGAGPTVGVADMEDYSNVWTLILG